MEEAGVKSLVMATALIAAAVTPAPPAAADMNLGNYELIMPDRRDFHTWVWSAITPCKEPNSNESIPHCVHVLTLPRPIAKAVQGGIGFTAEHEFHHHLKRALVLDGLLGSSRELTRKAGAGLRARGSAPRLVNL